jgi:WD40 repeat protein
MRKGRTILLLPLVLALAGADETKAARIQGSWDPLSKELIPRIASSVHDFGSLVLVARAASCRIDIAISMNVMPNPATASIRYSWEDRNDSGTIGGNEVETETESVSNAKLAPAVRDLRRGLEAQTVASVANVFASTNVKAVKIEGGHKLQVKPVDDPNVRKALGFDVAYITIDGNFLPVEVRAKDDAGGESTAKLRWEKHGDKYLSPGYFRTVTSESSRTEEERTDAYEVRDGIPLLRRVVIDSTISAITQVVTVHTELEFSEWKVEKRAKPLPPPGADEAEFEKPKPKPDEDEGLFGDETGRTPAPAPAGEVVRPLLQFASGQGRIRGLRFLPGGAQLLAGGAGGALVVWDAATGKEVRKVPLPQGIEGQVVTLDVSPDGRRAVAGIESDEFLLFEDIPPVEVVAVDLAGEGGSARLDSEIGQVTCVRFARDGGRLLVAGQRNRIEVWNPADWAPLPGLKVADFDEVEVSVIDLGRAPRFTLLAVVIGNRFLDLWDLEGARKVAGLEMGGLWVADVAFSADARTLAGAGVAGGVLCWDLRRPGAPVVLDGHKDMVERVCFLGERLVSGSRDRTVRIWDVAGRRCVQTLPEPKAQVIALAVSADGGLLAAAAADGTILVYRKG